MIDERSTLEDVCFEVAAALDTFSVNAVLTGGSAATVYSSGAYTSMDIDFVLDDDAGSSVLRAALASIGFEPNPTAGMFHHTRTTFTVDFPKGPLAIGGDYVRETGTLRRGKLKLRILTPTDCVRDRLAHFYHWDDFTALNAAVAVAKVHRDAIDFSRIQEWTVQESGTGKYDFRDKLREFQKRLKT